jgi:hypothetical protein
MVQLVDTDISFLISDLIFYLKLYMMETFKHIDKQYNTSLDIIFFIFEHELDFH